MLARWFLGLLFIVAGLSKVSNPWVFVHTVEGYNMLPSAISTPFGLALPWFEMMLGVYLFVGLFTRASAAVTIILSGVFLVALATQIVRGHTHQSCGCIQGVTNPIVAAFLGGNTIGAWDLFRDGVFTALAVLVFFVPRTPLSVDALLAGGPTDDDLCDLNADALEA
jgi:uncharacterized membrane protein YphA (DoxX/SURF4 family)